MFSLSTLRYFDRKERKNFQARTFQGFAGHVFVVIGRPTFRWMESWWGKSRVRPMPRATTRLHGREVREILPFRLVSFDNPSNYYFEGKKVKDIGDMYRRWRWRRVRDEGSLFVMGGMKGEVKLAGIVGVPGKRMLGRLAIIITIEGGGSSDTRRAATTRRGVRPSRALRFNTLACPYWAWASPARRTRTTASTIICRICLPRTSSRSSSYDPTARPPSFSNLFLSLSLSVCPTFLGKIRKEDNFVINNSRERSCDYILNSRKKIESIPDEIHVYIYIYFSPSLVDSPIRWFAGDGSIFVSKISRNRRFVWHYSLSLSPTVSLSLLRVDKPSSGCEKKIRMHAWKFDSFDLIFLELSIGEEGKIGSVFTYPIILYNTWL